jgi:hypothetical protein
MRRDGDETSAPYMSPMHSQPPVAIQAVRDGESSVWRITKWHIGSRRVAGRRRISSVDLPDLGDLGGCPYCWIVART